MNARPEERPNGDSAGQAHWREEFPYHWDTDDMVTRREFVRFAVLTSGALFAGTVALGIIGVFDNGRRKKRMQIATTGELKPGGVKYFHYPTGSDQAMLLRLHDGSYVAYSQKCTHLSCSVYYQPGQDRLYCPCHEGIFDVATGDPVAGPPPRPLPRILLDIRGRSIYATELVP